MKVKVLFLVCSLIVLLGVVTVGSGAVAPLGHGMYRLVGLFGEVVALVRSNYVEEVSYDRLELGALTGLVEAADPGGSFVPREWQVGYEKTRSRAVPAYGLVLGKRSSYPVVLQVIPGSPAAAAGILPGELIERIGKEAVRARPLWLAMVLLDRASSEATTASMDIIDRNLSGKREVTLSSRPFEVPGPTVEVKDGAALVRIQAVTPAGARAVADLVKPHFAVTGVVVDLRGLALGSVEGAAELAAVLAGGKADVGLVNRDGQKRAVSAAGPERTWKVVACVDTTTAGPAELLALTLKSRGGTLVGVETYGDTGQRKVRPGPEGEIWLASWWAVAADGKALLGDGVRPDEAVAPSRTGDAILDRALELGRGLALPKAA